jgi:hypothetical protein
MELEKNNRNIIAPPPKKYGSTDYYNPQPRKEKKRKFVWATTAGIF